MATVIQNVVFPQGKDPDTLPLYLDAETWTTIRDRPVRLTENAHVEDVLGRSSLRVRPGLRISLASYFNAFPAAYWQQWTSLRQVTLTVRTTGAGTLLVYRSSSSGAQQRVDSVPLSGPTLTELRLPLEAFGDGGWYWFDLVADDAGIVLEQAHWSTDAEPRTRANVSLGITTYDKPDYCLATLETLAPEQELLEEVDTIYVVDQGNRKVAAEDGFDEVAARLGSKLTIVDQDNLGGSGGFSRAMSETLDAGTSGFTLLLDDDVEVEPESILRSLQFSRYCRRPTIVGGHMFDLLDKPVLHAFAETIDRWLFLWRPTFDEQMRHDFRRANLRQTPWMHQRLDPDYNGWWMCMIPVEVSREIGLSLPVFIKWDDSEYGLRAAEHGYRTVSLPGSALWHVSWLDKEDSQDWQAYYHARNRLLAGLLHSPHKQGGILLRNSRRIDLKHLLAMQYYAATLRHRAIRDLLQGPEHLHRDIRTTMPQLRAATKDFEEMQVLRGPDEAPTAREGRRVFPPGEVASPTGPRLALFTLKHAVRHALRRTDAGAAPQVELAKRDALWWRVPDFDSAVIGSADGRGRSVYRRDREKFRTLWREGLALHRELAKNWDDLAKAYRDALPAYTSQQAWKETFEGPS